MRGLRVFGLALLPIFVSSVALTDEVQDADPPQSGYLTNHNINPNNLSWAKLWNNQYLSDESFEANPLVYTPKGYTHELVVIVSNLNNVRVLDSITGALISSLTLDPPFSAVDSNCNNIADYVGITGTPFIDSASDTMYFYAKGYINGQIGPQGTMAGLYKLWALNIPSLAVAPGFPVKVEGPSTNDVTRYFNGGTLLQRPGLTAIGDSIIAGFGGHCDSYNYTGMLVAVSKTTATVTNIIAMEASPGAPSPEPTVYNVGTGGKAGIWQSGMAIAADLVNNRVFFATGNGDGLGDNKGTGPPASGKIPISTLESAIVNFGVDPVTGVLTQRDYFQPTNYAALDSGDKDISSSGVALLDPATFSGGGVNRVAVCGSKAGVVYVLDADNLGGFSMGSGNTDAVLQELTFSGSFYNGVGSYPLEGGFIYLCTTGGYLQAYALTSDGLGRPNFIFAGQSAITLGCRGTPTVTSFNGQPGTGVVWMADSSQGLVAYQAVPINNVLVPITTIPGVGGLTKYQRPTFGNNRAYVTTGNHIIAVGGAPGPESASSVSSSSTSSTSTSASLSSSSSSSSAAGSTSTSSSSSSSSSSAAGSTSTSSSSSSSSSAAASSTSASSSPSSSSSSAAGSTSTPSLSSSSSSSTTSSTSTSLSSSSSSSSATSSISKSSSSSSSSSTKSSSSSSSRSSTATSTSSSSSLRSSTTLSSSVSSASNPVITKAPKCDTNNCNNQLRNVKISSEASVFCETYIATINTASSAIPAYLNNCKSSPSSVSSACSCLLYTPPASTSTSTSSTH